MRTNLQKYNASQAVGAKGITLVDYNAAIIEGLMAQTQPGTSRKFLGLIRQLAVDGHTIALEERSVIEHFDGRDALVAFNSPKHYVTTLATFKGAADLKHYSIGKNKPIALVVEQTTQHVPRKKPKLRVRLTKTRLHRIDESIIGHGG